jgi:hypothetical protein
MNVVGVNSAYLQHTRVSPAKEKAYLGETAKKRYQPCIEIIGVVSRIT